LEKKTKKKRNRRKWKEEKKGEDGRKGGDKEGRSISISHVLVSEPWQQPC